MKKEKHRRGCRDYSRLTRNFALALSVPCVLVVQYLGGRETLLLRSAGALFLDASLYGEFAEVLFLPDEGRERGEPVRAPSVCAEALVSFCGWCLFSCGSEEVSVCQRDECRLNDVVCSCATVEPPRACL